MDRAFIQKLIWTVLAIGVYVLTVFVPDVSSDLKVIAGLIIGAVWINARENARASLKPPPAAGALLVLPLLFGCAGTPADTALQNRLEANALRAEVNEASDVLAQAHGALPFVCAYLGPDSAACLTLEDSYRVLASAIDTAHRGIDLLDAVGVGAAQTRVAVERVLSEAKAFGSAVQRTGEEVANAIEADRRDRGVGGPVPERGPDASEGAPAEGASPQPAAAP